jgi:hypothetical protein
MSAAVAQPTYRRTAELPPLRMGREDFLAIIQRAQNIVERANSKLPTEKPDRIELQLSDRRHEITIQVPEHSNQLASAPKSVFKVTAFFWRPNAPISQVRIYMDDMSRTIEIAGTSPEQVDALTSYVQSELTSHRVWLAGFFARLALYAMLFLCVVVGATVLLTRTDLSAEIGLSLTSIIAVVSVGLLIWLLPFDQWLPGVAVVSGEASLLARWAPQFTLLGVFLGIISVLLPVILSERKKRLRPTSRRRHAKPPPPQSADSGSAA